MTTQIHLIASATTQEALVKMIARYFYGSTIRIEGTQVFNAIGRLKSYQVRKVKSRYRFERLPEGKEEAPDPDDRQFQEPVETGGPYSGYAGMSKEQYEANFTDRENEPYRPWLTNYNME